MTDSMIKKPLKSTFCTYNYYFNQIGSTNDFAKKFIIEKRMIGFAITAQIQSAGRGRGEKKWESPLGGLWTSLAVKPQIDLSMIGIVPLVTAIAITEILKTYDIKVVLKWPNDILLKDNLKKIGGILVEGKTLQNSLEYLIIGIGLNINTTMDQYPKSLRDQITSVFEEYNIRIDLNELLNELILGIEKYFNILNQNGSKFILEIWKKMDNILGMNVLVRTAEKDYYGKAIDISSDGHLILEINHSNRITLSDGTVFLSC